MSLRLAGCARSYQYHLRRGYLPGTDRYEEAYSLLKCESYGYCTTRGGSSGWHSDQ